MKRYLTIILAAAALVALAGCSREPLAEEPGIQVLDAEIVSEAGTRTTYDGTTGAFAWEIGDEMALFLTKGDPATYKLQNVEIKTASASTGRFVYSKETGWTRTGYAVYPKSLVTDASWNGTTLTVTLPTSYPASATTRLPLVADNGGGETSNLTFYPICGLLRIQCENIPSGVTSLTVTVAGGSNITGDHPVAFNSSIPSINAVVGTANTVTFSSVSGSSATLNLPLPCGTYTGVTVSDGTHTKSVTATFASKRGYGKKLTVDFSE